MTVAQSLPLPATAPAHPARSAGRGGRPRSADDPDKRKTQVKYAALVLTGALLVKQAAAAANVSRQTIWRWVNEQLASDEPEAEGLRRLIEQR